MGIIYKVTAPDGKIYVGQTIRSLRLRWQFHCYEASYGGERSLCQSIREHGIESFVVEQIEEVPEDQLNDRERYFIQKFDCLWPKGLNSTDGGGPRDLLAARQANSDGHRLHIPEDMVLPLNVRSVIHKGVICGFRVDVPGKKAYSFRQADLTLQEKFELAMEKYAEVLAGTDDHTENRKKKTAVGADLPKYIYCAEGARTIVRVIVPNHPVKVFSSNKKPKEELIAAAKEYLDKLLAGEVEEKPKAAKTLPQYICWNESKQQASFVHPRPSKGMMRQYSFQDSDKTKEELLELAVQIKDDILSGRVPEREKAVKKTLPTHITWRDDLHVATFRDPISKKTHNFGFKDSPESKEDLVEKAISKKLEVMGI